MPSSRPGPRKKRHIAYRIRLRRVSEHSAIPTEVIWARGARFHLQALYACAGVVALLTLIGGAALMLAGPLASDPTMTAGVLALLIGGITAIAGGVLAGHGQMQVFRAAADEVATDEALAVVAGILARTRERFSLLPRFALAGCAALIVAYVIWSPAGSWGAVVGTFVVVQAVLLLIVVRRFLLAGERLNRR